MRRKQLPIPKRTLRRERNTPRGDPTAKNVSTWNEPQAVLINKVNTYINYGQAYSGKNKIKF